MKKEGNKLVAVGTTVVRTLESITNINSVENFFYTRVSPSPGGGAPLESKKNPSTSSKNLNIFGKTDLFIFPPYDFRMVDIMITNFHLPQSSLMMLVEAFLQYKGAKNSLVDLYNIAIKNNFKFYSFGDAMLIL